MGILESIFSAAFTELKLHPVTGTSTTYKHWISIKDFRRCVLCYTMHGKIWRIEGNAEPSPPIHKNCRCKIAEMTTIEAGTATTNGIDGADWQLKNTRDLPEYYISLEDARSLGWRRGKT